MEYLEKTLQTVNLLDEGENPHYNLLQSTVFGAAITGYGMYMGIPLSPMIIGENFLKGMGLAFVADGGTHIIAKLFDIDRFKGPKKGKQTYKYRHPSNKFIEQTIMGPRRYNRSRHDGIVMHRERDEMFLDRFK